MHHAPSPPPPLSRADESLLRRLKATSLQHPARRLTISYAVGLLLIAALTVGAYLRVEGALKEQRDDAAIVNVAGKQRMLSQKISKAAMALASGAFGEARGTAFATELREALAAFRLGHSALTDGNDALGVPPTSDPEAVSRLARLEPSFAGLVDAAEAILGGENAARHLPALLAEQAQFLPEQDALVSRYAALSRAKIASLEADHARLLWMTIGLLLAEALLVFEPAARAMRRQLRCLHDAGEVMSHEARHDALTGLGNRNSLLQRLEALLRPGGGVPPEELAVFFLDFDGFKAINDSLGHEAGDRLLRAIAERARTLAGETRSGRLEAFRLGGDEFVFIVHGRSIGHEIRHLADRALLLFAQPHVLDGHPCVSTASIGIATAAGSADPAASEAERSPPARTASELLRNADLAMMQAKAAGKARYLLFDDAMYRFAQRRQRLERDLRAAIENDRLRLRYGPIHSANDMALVAAEALLHWEHESLGPIGHAELVEVAEESGRIHELAAWVHAAVAEDATACAAAAAGGAGDGGAGLPRIHLNVTRSEASHPAFFDRLGVLMASCPALGGRLCLEFDEASLGRGLAHLADLVKRVSALGVGTCIDHLGGSQASLADLAQLRIDRIKINPRAFKAGGVLDAPSLLVPRAITAFARGVGVEVTATAVDGRVDVATALDLRVDELQGRHFGEPVALTEILARVEAARSARRAA